MARGLNGQGLQEIKTARPSSGRWGHRLLLALCWPSMVIFALHACTHMVAAGDTWVAMACGRHFINHGVDTVEPFSANSHKAGPTSDQITTWPGWARWITDRVGIETVRKWHPTGWINQNWLTHVIFYWLTTTLGSEQQPCFNALVVWKVVIYLLSVACIYASARLLGAHQVLAATFASAALFIGRSFLDIRPAGFSNLLVAAFFLILILATYRNVLYVWLLVPLTVFWANVHGGYIYVFIMLVPFICLHLVSMAFRNKLVSMGWKGLAHTAAVYVVAFVAMVLFNPYHLTNLTHTFEISISKHAQRWRNVHEWHPAFAWDNPVGTAVPFLVMYILAWLVLVVLLFLRWQVASAIKGQAGRAKRRSGSAVYDLPKIDIALWAVVALTIYMAIRSRRFIPIAAFVACPLMASMVDQILRAIPACTWIGRQMRPEPQSLQRAVNELAPVTVMVAVVTAGLYFLPRPIGLWLGSGQGAISRAANAFNQWWFGKAGPNVPLVFCSVAAAVMWSWLAVRRYGIRTAAPDWQAAAKRFDVTVVARAVAVGFVLGFGVWAGMRFKVVYVDPWAPDPVHTSIFMRMTASFLKPFEACRFIRDNRLSGKMMNYWTEGGFIAWGQDPDPNTGKTPLQLFMDGRAQAAYNVSAFDQWSYIWAGGEPVEELLAANRQATGEDYRRIGQWISQRLRSHGVWVALVPAQQFDSVFARGIEASGQWPTVYLDNKQKLYVDINSPQGRVLFEGVPTGQTKYPDQFLRDLNLAAHLLVYDPSPEAASKGLEHAMAAYRARPTPMPMLLILGPGARQESLRTTVKAFCDQICRDFELNRAAYRRTHGYRARMEAVRLACNWLASVAAGQGDLDLARSYQLKAEDYAQERDRLTDLQRW